jgi:hypothetical protein
VPTATYFTPLLRIARILKEYDIAAPVLYAPTFFPGATAMEASAHQCGVPWLCFMKPDLSGYFDTAEHVRSVDLPWQPAWRGVRTIDLLRRRTPLRARLTRVLVEWVDRRSWHGHRSLHDTWTTLHAAQVGEADLVLDALAIDLVLVPDETMDYNVPFLLASARAAGLRSLLLQLAVPSLDEIDGVLAARADNAVRDRCQRAFAGLFPRWVRTVGGRRLLRAPLGRALAAELDGLAPRHPWLSFTFGSDAIGVNSPYLRDRLVELGGTDLRGKMVLTGLPEDDAVLRGRRDGRALRAELAAECGWRYDRPIALVNPVNDLTAQHSLSQFGSYEDLLRFWLAAVRDLHNFNVVVTPHPYFRFAAVARRVLEQSGIPVVWRGAAELMPACDLYVAYGGSSTFRLAAATGLPALNYLCYDLDYAPADAPSYFDGFDTIRVVRRREEMLRALRELDDPASFSDLRERAEKAAPYFGPPGQGFPERISVVVRMLAGRKGPVTGTELAAIRDATGRAAGGASAERERTSHARRNKEVAT